MSRLPALAAAFLGIGLVAASPAAAHIPSLRGHLIELVRGSDLVVAGTVLSEAADGPGRRLTTIRVESVLAGKAEEKQLRFRGRTRFVPQRRYVFFLQRAGDVIECPQGSGTLFPASAEDDAAYRAAVDRIRRALGQPPDLQAEAMRAALIATLTATPQSLRYHAAFDLAAVGSHDGPPTLAQRAALNRLLDDPQLDPALRPFLTALLR